MSFVKPLFYIARRVWILTIVYDTLLYVNVLYHYDLLKEYVYMYIYYHKNRYVLRWISNVFFAFYLKNLTNIEICIIWQNYHNQDTLTFCYYLLLLIKNQSFGLFVKRTSLFIMQEHARYLFLRKWEEYIYNIKHAILLYHPHFTVSNHSRSHQSFSSFITGSK